MNRRTLLPVLLALTMLPACAEDDPINPSERVRWTDANTGLCWQVEPRDCPVGMTDGIVDLPGEYCNMLGKGWRVPTIDELRSLLLGCPANELGGECGVTDPSCLDASAECSDECDLLMGCEWGAGPGVGGYFQPPEISASKCFEILSSSIDETGQYGALWYVNFKSGTLGTTVSAAECGGVRCVRDEP